MAHDGLWEQIDRLDAGETAGRAGCKYPDDEGRYVVTFLNREYVVEPGSRQVLLSEEAAGFLEQLCILAYLISAKDVPLANRLVRAEALPDGDFFFRGLHSLATGKLVEAFGEHPDRLYEAASHFGAKRSEYADASIELLVLPRLPLTFVLWRSDNEFAARASILFDATAGEQLPLDALLTAVNLAVKAVVEAAT